MISCLASKSGMDIITQSWASIMVTYLSLMIVRRSISGISVSWRLTSISSALTPHLKSLASKSRFRTTLMEKLKMKCSQWDRQAQLCRSPVLPLKSTLVCSPRDENSGASKLSSPGQSEPSWTINTMVRAQASERCWTSRLWHIIKLQWTLNKGNSLLTIP